MHVSFPSLVHTLPCVSRPAYLTTRNAEPRARCQARKGSTKPTDLIGCSHALVFGAAHPLGVHSRLGLTPSLACAVSIDQKFQFNFDVPFVCLPRVLLRVLPFLRRGGAVSWLVSCRVLSVARKGSSWLGIRSGPACRSFSATKTRWWRPPPLSRPWPWGFTPPEQAQVRQHSW